MMDVQLMRRIVDPIEAGEMPRIVQAAAARWHGDSIRFFRSSANHVFRMSQDGAPRFLRLSNGADHSRESILAELEFVEHAASQGVPAARAVLSDGGELVETLQADGLVYHAVTFEALQGDVFEAEELDAGQTRAWGRALAGLHRASTSFPVHFARPALASDVRAVAGSLPPDERDLRERLERGADWLSSLPDQPHGLIHGDFESDNLVWDGERFQALDFDDAAYAPYAIDIGIAVYDIRDDAARLDWFFEGYAEVLPAPDGVRDALPDYHDLLLAIKVARLLRAYATTTDDDQPGWLAKMRDRHREWLAARRAHLQC